MNDSKKEGDKSFSKIYVATDEDIKNFKRTHITKLDYYWLYKNGTPTLQKKDDKPIKLNDFIIKQHLQGEIIIGLNHHINDKYVDCGTIDLDCHIDDPKEAEKTIKKNYDDWFKLTEYLTIHKYVYRTFTSDQRGYHIIIYCKPNTLAKDMCEFLTKLQTHKLGSEPHEVFPKQDDLSDTNKHFGNQTKLPLGNHQHTGNVVGMYNEEKETTYSKEESMKQLVPLIKELDKLKDFKIPKELAAIKIEEKTIIDNKEGDNQTFCGFIENVAAIHKLPSVKGCPRHNYLDPFAWHYCNRNNKPDVLKKFMKAQGRNSTAFNDADKVTPLCGTVIKYLKNGDPNDDGIKKGLEECNKCQYKKDKKDPKKTTAAQTLKLKLIQSTKHLPHFEDLDNAIGLYGDQYKPIKKLLYYKLLGNTQRGDEPIELGSCNVDTRINMLTLVNSGKGKNNLKQAIKKTTPIGLQTVEVTSFHQEQFVGKMVQETTHYDDANGKSKTKKEYVERRGYFNQDEVILDETRNLLSLQEFKYQESRGYICLALDVVGSNQINKQQVADGDEHRLEYDAKCAMTLFSQPVRIIKEVLESGFIRRFLLSSCENNNNDVESVYMQRIKGKSKKIFYERFKEFLHQYHIPSIEQEDFGIKAEFELEDDKEFKIKEEPLKENVFENGDWKFEDGVDILIVKYAALLNDLCCDYSPMGEKYTNAVFEQTILDLMIKFSCICTVYHNNNRNVNIENVEIAYMDLFEFLYNHIALITKYGEDFYEMDIQISDFNCLKHLYKFGATTEKSSKIQIKEFIVVICNERKMNYENARHIYRKLSKKEVICSSKGQHNSKIWLTEIGVNIVEKNINWVVPTENTYYHKYLEICKKNTFESGESVRPLKSKKGEKE